MGKLRVLFALDRRERLVLLRAWLWLGAAWAALRLLPFHRVERALAGAPPASQDREGLKPERVVFLVDAAARRLPMSIRCLPRALVLRRALRVEGLPAELRIGVRRRDAGLEAHAWVEVGGVAMGESGEVGERFGALRRLV